MSVEQLNQVLDFFPSAGYLRVQLLLSVFSRLVDLENLWPSIDKLFNEDERDEVSAEKIFTCTTLMRLIMIMLSFS